MFLSVVFVVIFYYNLLGTLTRGLNSGTILCWVFNSLFIFITLSRFLKAASANDMVPLSL